MAKTAHSSKRPPFWFWALVLAALIGIMYTAQRKVPGGVGWQRDLSAARRQARDAAKPLLLYFASPMDHDSDEMAGRLRRIERHGGHVTGAGVPVYLDWGDEATGELAERYEIADIPALVVVDADNQMLHDRLGRPLRVKGYTGETELRELLERVPANTPTNQ